MINYKTVWYEYNDVWYLSYSQSITCGDEHIIATLKPKTT
jgi:hypothetical protein